MKKNMLKKCGCKEEFFKASEEFGKELEKNNEEIISVSTENGYATKVVKKQN